LRDEIDHNHLATMHPFFLVINKTLLCLLCPFYRPVNMSLQVDLKFFGFRNKIKVLMRN